MQDEKGCCKIKVKKTIIKIVILVAKHEYLYFIEAIKILNKYISNFIDSIAIIMCWFATIPKGFVLKCIASMLLPEKFRDIY